MHDKSTLGTRYTCFQCGTKFYDLNRPEPFCPECGADQREAPARDIRALLSGKSRVRGDDDDESIPTSLDADDSGDDDEFDDDLGLDEDEDEDEDEEEEAGGEDW